MSKNIEGFGDALRVEAKRMERFDQWLADQADQDIRNTIIGSVAVIVVAIMAAVGFVLFG